jgi:hypothetical protein
MVSRPRSSLSALGKPLLFADALNQTFPMPTRPTENGLPETAIPVSNADIARLVGQRLGLSEVEQQTLKIQIGRYRTGKNIPDRRMIGLLAAGLGIPPMVLMIYAGRFEEIFGFINALAALSSAPPGWPLRRSSPRRAAFALLFSTFPTLDDPIQSEVARQATTADQMFFHGPERLSYHIGQLEERAKDEPLAKYLAGWVTDGAFILPARPSFKDLDLRKRDDDQDGAIIVIADPDEEPTPSLPDGIIDYEFELRSEYQVDVSGDVATWVFHNVEPALAKTDMLRRAVSALNDKDYPIFDRFALAGFIGAQWAHRTDSNLVGEVLSNLWRWDRQNLTRREAVRILRTRAQHRESLRPRLRRLLKRIERPESLSYSWYGQRRFV